MVITTTRDPDDLFDEVAAIAAARFSNKPVAGESAQSALTNADIGAIAKITDDDIRDELWTAWRNQCPRHILGWFRFLWMCLPLVSHIGKHRIQIVRPWDEKVSQAEALRKVDRHI